MAEAIDAVAGSTVRPEWAVPVDQTGPTNELGKDEFLQLLVAQLKYQDPLEPTSSDEFISTTAQFTVVEKLDELTKQGANTALITSLATAGNLVGREVTANRDGVAMTAVVQRSRIASGKVVLETSEGDISLNQIISIGAAWPVGAASTGSSGSTDSSGSAGAVAAPAAVPAPDFDEPAGETVVAPPGPAVVSSGDEVDELVDAFIDAQAAAAAGHGPPAEGAAGGGGEEMLDGPLQTSPNAAYGSSLIGSAVEWTGPVEYVDGIGYVEVVGGPEPVRPTPVVQLVQPLETLPVLQPLVIVEVPDPVALMTNGQTADVPDPVALMAAGQTADVPDLGAGSTVAESPVAEPPLAVEPGS